MFSEKKGLTEIINNKLGKEYYIISVQIQKEKPGVL